VRAFGALAMFIVAANPRLYFYDATVVAVGMMGLWLASQTVGSPQLRRAASLVALLVWFSLWGGVFIPLNVLVGPLGAVALLLAAVDHRSTSNLAEKAGFSGRAVWPG